MHPDQPALHVSQDIPDDGSGPRPAGPEHAHELFPGPTPPHEGDGTYLDDLFLANPNDPHLAPIEFPRHGDQSTAELGKVTTKIMVNQVPAGTPNGGVQQPPARLFPADENRTSLTIRTNTAAVNAPVLVASSKAELDSMAITTGAEGSFWTNDTSSYTLHGHTGEVWVMCVAVNSVTVTGTAVTY